MVIVEIFAYVTFLLKSNQPGIHILSSWMGVFLLPVLVTRLGPDFQDL